ncbi:unnamed protein product [Mesocestoides corti]|uniref:PX domain-containing protein n=1 Tax=Mesocestoides corti TaxID=53468 RepID=A0A0R3UAL5_MESCO|nr:unnamed protein product [Mesocestoides corti]
MLTDRQSSQAAPASTLSIDSLTFSISEFSYDPEDGIKFESWYRRYEDLFRVDLASQDDVWKVKLLTCKLSPAELKRYTYAILPKSSVNFNFVETVQNLKRMFGERASLFSARYRCLKLAIGEFDDILYHLAVVSRECKKSHFKLMTDDQLKNFILICSLQMPTNAAATPDQYLHWSSVLHDSTMVQAGGRSATEVNAVQRFHKPPATSRPS